jgi:hypothetical protein
MHSTMSRRLFLQHAAGGLAAGLMAGPASLLAQIPGDRPQPAEGVTVLNPLARVPASLIIDDSTCLVNLNRFAVPQFAEAFQGQGKYDHDWRKWPHEIPDSFVRKFGEWCGERGVKGKYSVVPYPACVGRLDRGLPGWTKKELDNSLNLVRTLLLPNWDIHPEMVTHTRVIDLNTGHPYPDINPNFMENWDWAVGKSVPQIADYLAYALQILKNVGLPCEGITTPGGFGNRALPELSQAVLLACRDVFATEIPHYFKFLISQGNESVAPRIEYASGLDTADPKCVVRIIGCTGDWTGGWDCSDKGDVDKFITADLKRGRAVEIIERGEPCLLFGHWTGFYWHGEEHGFKVFQEAVRRITERYPNLLWMKLTEVSRYWAAKELTRFDRAGEVVSLRAPFGTPRFTVRIAARDKAVPKLVCLDKPIALREAASLSKLQPGLWTRDGDGVIVCFDLPKGSSRIDLP